MFWIITCSLLLAVPWPMTAFRYDNNPRLISFPKDIKGLHGESVIFVCKAEGNPMPDFDFYLNQAKVKSTNENIDRGAIIQRIEPNQATMRLKLDKSMNNSVVECKAKNRFGEESDRGHITVYTSDKYIPVNFPVISFDSQPILDQTGSKVRIQCDIRPNSLETKVFWLKNTSFPIDVEMEPRYSEIDNSLEINSIRSEDEGFYECVAYNSDGMRISSQKNVAPSRVSMPPAIDELPETIYVSQSSSTNLTCHAVGFPDPTVWWSVKRESGERQIGKKEQNRKELDLKQSDSNLTFVCNAKNSLGKVSREVVVKVKQPPSPPTHLETSWVNGTSAVIQWSSRGLTKDDSFTISYKPLVEKPNKLLSDKQIPGIMKGQLKKDNSAFTLTDLKPNTDYLLTIYAISKQEGPSESSETLRFKTTEIAPESSPHSIIAFADSEDSIKLSWSQPLYPNGLIKGYKVFYSKNDDDHIDTWSVARSDKESCILNRLTSDAIYFIRISAHNSAGDGPLSEIYPVIVKPGVPTRPQNFQATPVNVTALKLSWSRVEVSDVAKLLNYELKFRESFSQDTDMNTINIDPDREDYILPNLKPGTIYTLSLAGRSDRGVGIASQISKRTKNYVPKAPMGESIEVLNSTAVRLKFQTKANQMDSLSDYQIAWTKIPKKGMTPERNSYTLNLTNPLSQEPIVHIVNNLDPNTEYKMTVSGVNEMGTGDAYEFHPVRTKSDVPLTPLHLKATSVEVRSRTLPSGEVIQYPVVEVCWVDPPDAPRDIKYELVFIMRYVSEISPKVIRIAKMNCYTSKEEDNLKFGINYRVRLSVFGSSKNSGYVECDVTMPIAKPSGPPNDLRIRAIDSSTAHLSWNAPELLSRNGDIRGYIIRYGAIYSNGYRNKELTNSAEITANITDPEIKQYEAKNIDPEKIYNFRVKAYNDAGEGVWAIITGFRINAKAPSPPDNIKSHWLNSNQIKVSWSAPEQTSNIPIHGYRIEYKQNGNLVKNTGDGILLDTPPVTMAILSNLDSNKPYTIQIKSRGSDGQFSKWSDLNFISSNPKIANERTVNSIDCTCDINILELSWNAPELVKDLKGFKLKFEGRLHYVDANGVNRTEIKPGIDKFMNYRENHSDYKFTMTDLEPNTEYLSNIVSVYTDGSESGPYQSSCMTKMDSPDFVPAPIPTSYQREQLQVLLTLKRVSERLGRIRDYFLVISPSYLALNGTQPKNIQHLLEEAQGRKSSEVMYVAAQFSSQFFRKGENSREFLLGDPSLMYKLVDKVRFRRDLTSNMREVDSFYEEETSGVTFHDNKPLLPGKMYKAALMACIFNEDQSQKCSISEWSPSFFPDQNQLIYDNPIKPLPSLISWLTKHNWFTTAIIVSCVGITLLFLCLIFIGCFLKRKVSTQMKLNTNNSKQPNSLMRNGAHTTHNEGSMLKHPLVISSMNNCGGPVLTQGPTSSTSSPFNGVNSVYQINEPGTIQRSSNGILNTSFIGNGVGNNGTIPKSLILSSNDCMGNNNMNTKTNQMLMGLNQANGTTFDIFEDKFNTKAYPSSAGHHNVTTLNKNNPNMGGKSGDQLRPIPISQLKEHVHKLFLDQGYLMNKEYASIDPPHQFTWDNSNMEVNKPKNRYANVVAYDHSRVVLQPIEGLSGSDYINANYIDGYDKPNFYIATQGPMKDTISDFWRMIWEQNVCIIVMMTRLEERSRIKCDQYWPNRGIETFANGMLTVTLVETKEFAYYSIRKFTLTAANDCITRVRDVEHYQFTNWPDHGVPEYPIPLLLFMKRVRSAYNNLKMNSLQNKSQFDQSYPILGPMVVHCSAGVGRTGAFIVLDIMLEQMHYEKTVDVYQCVSNIRAQRNFMVQTEDQYVFIYTSLIEAIEAGHTEIPIRNLYNHLKSLSEVDPISGVSGLEIEWQKTVQFRLMNARFNAAVQRCNKLKNNIQTLLPYDSSRVVLSQIRGLEGSDYINASHLDGYASRRMYIATQSPNNNTIEDFWRMIWEKNSTILVNLTNQGEIGRYWPCDKPSRYQFYIVEPKVEYNMQNYTLREFKINDTRDGQSRTLRQFQFTDWIETSPNSHIPQSSETFIEFINQIHKTKDQFGQDGPITVHCDHGFGRTGLFIGLSIILEKMRFEGVVDTFQTIRLLRTQRPGIISSLDQYQFCYSSALEYISSSYDGYSM